MLDDPAVSITPLHDSLHTRSAFVVSARVCVGGDVVFPVF